MPILEIGGHINERHFVIVSIHQVLAKPTIQDITTVTHANNITGYSTGVESKHQHGHCCYCLCMVSNLQEPDE